MGKQKRHRLKAETLEEAVREAIKCVPGAANTPSEATVAGVLKWWCGTTAAKKETLADYETYCRLFIRWAVSRGFSLWKDLEWDHLQAYSNELAAEGKSKDTIRLYTLPIRYASERAARKWSDDFRNFAEGYSIPRTARGPKKQDAKPLVWIGEFLNWLRYEPDGWKILPGVAIQGLCGLRVTEILRLTWDRIDLVRGEITVAGETKNQQSERRIPVPALVLDILKMAPRNGDRVVSDYCSKHSWLKALTSRRSQTKKGVKVHPGFMDRFQQGSYIPPKDLRNTLPTERRRHLWNREILDLYMGRKDRAVIDKNYTWLPDDDLVELYRSEVVAKVDEILVDQMKRWRGIVGNVVALGNS